MIYLDSSVALAQLFGEGRSPPNALWQEPLVSSRLIEYEIWNHMHARGFGRALGASARALIGRLRLIGLTPPVLARAQRCNRIILTPALGVSAYPASLCVVRAVLQFS